MKILFAYSELVVERVNGILYHNFLPDILKRYSQFGDLTVCVSVKDFSEAYSKIIEQSNNERFVFINKENNIRARYFKRKENVNILKEEISNADLVIVHVPCSIQDIIQRWCKKLYKPYIAVVVGCPFDSLSNHSMLGKLIAPLSYFSLKKFMANTSYSIYVTNQFLQHRYPTAGISIGCSDVAIPYWKNEDILNDRNLLIHSVIDTVNMVSVGAVDNRVKGHEDVIKSLKYLNSSKRHYFYHLIGGGDPSRLKRIAKSCGVEKYVVFHGQKSHDEIFSLLKGMHIYIQPSRTEGLSRAIVEAMSVGCPVIATKVGGNPELVPLKYLYKPKDIHSLSLLISNLTDVDEMERQSKEAFKKSLDFSKDKLDRRRSDFIQDVIDIEAVLPILD